MDSNLVVLIGLWGWYRLLGRILTMGTFTNSSRKIQLFKSLSSKFDPVVSYITKVLMRIIDENIGGFSNDEYRVRTVYSNSKFYLNKVGFTKDESIHLLIHRIMYVEKLYHQFLSPDHIKKLDKHPDLTYLHDNILWIKVEENIKGRNVIDEFLDEVYYECIHNVFKKLEEESNKVSEVISLKEDFHRYLEPTDWDTNLNGISSK
jgi:hypothetical protein